MGSFKRLLALALAALVFGEAYGSATRIWNANVFRMDDSSSAFHTDLQSATISGNQTFTFPTSTGSSGQTLRTDGTGVLSWISNPAITATTGDVSATGPGSVAATVNSVGGSTAASVHTAELLANAATNANTPSTIVERDASGNFSAGTISAALSGNATNVTGTIALNHGGTGQTTKAPAFDALQPMTTAGDLIYGGASGTGTRLAPGTATQVLHSGATPSWSGVSLTADVTGTLPVANGGSGATTVTAARTAFGITSGISFLTSGTTFTTAASTTTATKYKFTLVGGGGGGGGTATTNGHGAGGGGGGACAVFLTNIAASTALTIAIGAGGASGTNTPTAGGAGGDTTLTVAATTYTASGGLGGSQLASQPQGGAGGATTNCTIAITGQAGDGSTAAGTQSAVPAGGNTGFGLGLGGHGSVNFVGLDGNNGTGYGGGGAGGGPGNATGIGGAGAAGAILVEYWN